MSIEFLSPLDPRYPKLLLANLESPPGLYYRGNIELLSGDCLGVVGSRRPMPTTRAWVDEVLREFLTHYPICVVSGGARGVDQAAHAMALRLKLPTVVFLPSGLEQVYPADLKSWIRPILSGGGCLVSAYPPLVAMRKRHFLERNRLIAALSPLLLVAQAARRSGTQITARAAMQFSHSVAVMPGFPDAWNLGSLDLICEGAIILRDWRDLVQARQWGRSLATVTPKAPESESTKNQVHSPNR